MLRFELVLLVISRFFKNEIRICQDVAAIQDGIRNKIIGTEALSFCDNKKSD